MPPAREIPTAQLPAPSPQAPRARRLPPRMLRARRAPLCFPRRRGRCRGRNPRILVSDEFLLRVYNYFAERDKAAGSLRVRLCGYDPVRQRVEVQHLEGGRRRYLDVRLVRIGPAQPELPFRSRPYRRPGRLVARADRRACRNLGRQVPVRPDNLGRRGGRLGPAPGKQAYRQSVRSRPKSSTLSLRRPPSMTSPTSSYKARPDASSSYDTVEAAVAARGREPFCERLRQ